MQYDFGRIIDRRSSDSVKWNYYGDAIPLWVADMDFQAPEPVIRALGERVAHGIFGYGMEPPELRPLIVDHLHRLHGWEVPPEAVIFLPGIVSGFNQAAQAVTLPGDGLLVQTPVYFPFLYVPRNAQLVMNQMELTQRDDGQFEVDFDRFEATITGRTRMFLLCNPHNPVGRVFTRAELERMADICLRHDMVICSDEIHCDLVFDGHEHISIASLSPEIERRTITLIAPSKTYNIAGIHASVGIITDPDLRQKFEAARAGLVPHLGVLGYTAMLAAYRDGEPWLEQAMAYMQANRDFLLEYVNERLPGLTMAKPEGTYLAWIDCRGADLPGNPHKFFLEEAGVAMNDGASFGQGGEGFVRLNFACPRATLVQALEQMRDALIRHTTKSQSSD
jgi:cystathionine beta-lyase